MAIRIRRIDGHLVALCAARAEEKPEDIYINDEMDHALRIKFLIDYESEGLIKEDVDLIDKDERNRIEREENL